MSVRTVSKSAKSLKRRRSPQEDMTRALNDVALDEAGVEDAECEADLYDYLVYLEEIEKQAQLEKEWEERMQKEDDERRRTTCTCEHNAYYDDECVSEVCKCICPRGFFATCRARIHTCACHRDLHGRCLAYEHNCVCGQTMWRDFCTSFCDYTYCSCPPAEEVELVCKLHTCMCSMNPEDCLVDVHQCICSKGSVRWCMADAIHSCSCDYSVDTCRGSAHKCTCRSTPERCCGSVHNCTCWRDPARCRGVEHVCCAPEKEGEAPSCRVMLELLRVNIPYAVSLNIHDNLVVKRYWW